PTNSRRPLFATKLSLDSSRIVFSHPICLLFENIIRRPRRVKQQLSKRKTWSSSMMRDHAENGSWLSLKISSAAPIAKSELLTSAQRMGKRIAPFLNSIQSR
ncbi:Uncharacterized protein APZ42_006052, partial [Daphnia magna]